MKHLKIYILLAILLFPLVSFSQLKCLSGSCNASVEPLSTDVMSGGLGCSGSNASFCREKFVINLGPQNVGFVETLYCNTNPDGTCPTYYDCRTKKIIGSEDRTFEEAIAILKKYKNKNSTTIKMNKLSKDEAKKVVFAINKLDFQFFKDMPSSDVQQIEEFKLLPINKQLELIAKPFGPRYIAEVATATFVAGTYVAQKAYQAYQDSLFGGDHLKKKSNQKSVNEKSFDLKN